MEHRVLREHPLVRQRNLHHRRRHARGGVQEVPHQCGQQVRPGQRHAEGEGREPAGRGHPRGPDRHHLGPSAGPAVRGPDQGQAGQRPGALPGRAGHQREAGRVVRGEPPRGRPDHPEGHVGRPGPGGGPVGPRPHPPEVVARRSRAARASSSTARRGIPGRANCSSSRATRPAVRPRTPATRRPRPSCPSGGRSSTSSGPASTRC